MDDHTDYKATAVLACGRTGIKFEQDFIHAPNILPGLFELRPLGEQRMVKNDMGERVETRFVGLACKARNQRMLDIDLENRLGIGQRLTGRLEHAPQLWTEIVRG